MGYAVHLLSKKKKQHFCYFTFVKLGLQVCFSHFSGFNIQGASSGSKNGDEDDEEVLDEETLRRDQVVKGAIDVLIREYASELNAPSQDPDSQPRNKKRKEKKEEVLFA